MRKHPTADRLWLVNCLSVWKAKLSSLISQLCTCDLQHAICVAQNSTTQKMFVTRTDTLYWALIQQLTINWKTFHWSRWDVTGHIIGWDAQKVLTKLAEMDGKQEDEWAIHVFWNEASGPKQCLNQWYRRPFVHRFLISVQLNKRWWLKRFVVWGYRNTTWNSGMWYP